MCPLTFRRRVDLGLTSLAVLCLIGAHGCGPSDGALQDQGAAAAGESASLPSPGESLGNDPVHP